MTPYHGLPKYPGTVPWYRSSLQRSLGLHMIYSSSRQQENLLHKVSVLVKHVITCTVNCILGLLNGIKLKLNGAFWTVSTSMRLLHCNTGNRVIVAIVTIATDHRYNTIMNWMIVKLHNQRFITIIWRRWHEVSFGQTWHRIMTSPFWIIINCFNKVIT